MSKKLIIFPNHGSENFIVGIQDGLESYLIGEFEGIETVFESKNVPDWTMKHPLPVQEQEKELFTLNKIIINQRRFEKKCFDNIKDCCRKLLKDHGPMTAGELLNRLILMNGGKDRNDINSEKLAWIIKDCFNYKRPTNTHRFSAVYYLDGQTPFER